MFYLTKTLQAVFNVLACTDIVAAIQVQGQLHVRCANAYLVTDLLANGPLGGEILPTEVSYQTMKLMEDVPSYGLQSFRLKRILMEIVGQAVLGWVVQRNEWFADFY